jgi:cell division protein FtsA
MDTRIGYPTEHLASGNDKVASPMYATGVGLVLKGFQSAEKNNRKESNISKPRKAGKKGVGLFDRILSRGKEWFEEDDNV